MRFHGLILGAGALLVAGSACAERVSGTVEIPGLPELRATVTLRGPLQSKPTYLVTGDEHGRFAIDNVAPGEYQVQISTDHLNSHFQFIVVRPGEDRTLAPVTLILDPGCRGGETVRTVTETAGLRYGPPLVRYTELEDSRRSWVEGWIRSFDHPFQISITRHGDAQPLRTLTTGVENRFEFADLPPGKYRLRAFTTKHAKNFADFVIEELEVKPGHMTEILDGLNMQRCLMGFKCKPVTMTWSDEF